MTKQLRVLAAAALAGVLALTGCAGGRLAQTTARGNDPSATGGPATTGVRPTPPVSPPSTPTSSTPSSSGPDTGDFAAVRRLLAIRARAVVAGDLPAFMATIDTRRPAFVASQRVMFANLQDLPLTSRSYDVGASGLTDAPGITGGPLLTPPVVEHVYFAGTDRRPMASVVDETFVERAGHWRLASDSTDLRADGGVTARPWAGPRLDVVVQGHLIVVADASATGRAAGVAATVAAGLAFDADILDVPVDDHLMVDATSSGSVSTFDNDESAGAVTFPVESERDFAPAKVAGLRVKLNPQYITKLLSDPVLLRHELTHFLMFTYTGVNPIWLTEGLAEYVSHQPAGLSTEYLSTESYARLMGRPRVITVSGLFGMDPATDYPLAMACVTYLVDHGGVSRLEELMAAYAVHREQPYGDAYTGHLVHRLYDSTPSDVARGAFDLLDALR